MRYGMITGSFDPITNGHQWMIEAASKQVDKLVVVVGANASKHTMFSIEDRERMVGVVCNDVQSFTGVPIRVTSSWNEMLVHTAKRLGCTTMFRGLRDANDFNYESHLLMVNRRIEPSIETVFLIPPKDLIEVSSSMVKGLTGFGGWADVASSYVHPDVLKRLITKMEWI